MIRRTLLCFLLTTGLAAAQSYEKRIAPLDPAARQTFERQPKIAVLVGVGAYPEGSGLSPLKYPAQDVAELAAELEKQGYAVRQLTDAQASRGVVVRTLSEIGQAIDPDQGTLLFYFSGHGFAAKDSNYLATWGVTSNDLEREGLALSEVERLIKETRARRQVLWIDACRNDAGSGARDVTRRSFAQLNAAEGMRVLYSTRAGSVSYEDDALKHGVFTYYLLRGLRGEAAGSDGLVTFQDLAGYVSQSVLAYGVKTGRIQRPFEAGEASGDFLLVKSGTAGAPSTGAPPATLQTPPPGRPGRQAIQSRTVDGLQMDVMGCAHKATAVVCDLRIKNMADAGIYWLIGDRGGDASRVVDDSDAVHVGHHVQAGAKIGDGLVEIDLPVGIFLGYQITFEGVGKDVKGFSMIEMLVAYTGRQASGIHPSKFRFENIPVSEN